MEGFGRNHAGSRYNIFMTNHGLDVEEKFWADMSDTIIDSMEAITGMDTDDLSDAEYLAVSGAILEVVKDRKSVV